MANIFITGGAGLLGWSLTKELLRGEDVLAHLLVRSNAKYSARERIFNLIKKDYDKNERSRIADRIKIIEGDITKKNLGINKTQIEELSKKINIIYHSAALCEFKVPLQIIRKINVYGTKNVLDFALKCKEKGRFKSFHHVSTVAVMGKFGGIFYEDALSMNQEFNNTYEQTKFEAEKLVNRYRKEGLSISVYRPSIITGDSVTGETSNFQMLYQPLHIFSLEIFDKIPVNKSLKYNLVPVDYVAKTIYLISSDKNNNKNYHLTNPNTIMFDFLLDIASSYFGFKKPDIIPERGFNFKSLEGFRWKLLEPYLPYLNHKKVVFDTTNFDKAINKKGFLWPAIDKKLLLRLFKYCAEVNYIPRHI